MLERMKVLLPRANQNYFCFLLPYFVRNNGTRIIMNELFSCLSVGTGSLVVDSTQINAQIEIIIMLLLERMVKMSF